MLRQSELQGVPQSSAQHVPCQSPYRHAHVLCTPRDTYEGLMILQGQCDGAEQAPEASTALLPNQCVLTMSGQARYFIATDGPGHQPVSYTHLTLPTTPYV